jgi:hemerythrin superfamily protein
MQDTPTTGARADAIEFLTAQHRDVEQLWKHLEVAHRDADLELEQDLGRRIIAMLSQHDALETMILYPVLRGLDGGDFLADHALEEHREIRELLAEVDGKDLEDEREFRTLARAIDLVQGHVEEEEGTLFPALRAVGQERLYEMGDAMEKAMHVVPTHPHPSTPDSGIGAALMGTVAGVVDRARDALAHARH